MTGTYVTVVVRIDGAAHSYPNRSSPDSSVLRHPEVLLFELALWPYLHCGVAFLL